MSSKHFLQKLRAPTLSPQRGNRLGIRAVLPPTNHFT
jgi:hypothetical protein